MNNRDGIRFATQDQIKNMTSSERLEFLSNNLEPYVLLRAVLEQLDDYDVDVALENACNDYMKSIIRGNGGN